MHYKYTVSVINTTFSLQIDPVMDMNAMPSPLRNSRNKKWACLNNDILLIIATGTAAGQERDRLYYYD